MARCQWAHTSPQLLCIKAVCHPGLKQQFTTIFKNTFIELKGYKLKANHWSAGFPEHFHVGARAFGGPHGLEPALKKAQRWIALLHRL